jgi:23S rRNA (adenine2503-C2)-methyltransferase
LNPTPVNFYDLTLPQLSETLAGLGKEKFRAQQLYKWVYQMGVTDFSQMTNLSKNFREDLPQVFDMKRPPLVKHLVSQDGTEKFLFDIGDGKTVETVLIINDERLTLCVSSEVGCNMGCRFCYTAKQKLQRRLTTGEIVGQFLGVQETIAPRRISNIVFMGMGEPLDNPDAVFGSIEVLCSEWGVNLSKKRITVSTSGLVPMIPLVAASKTRLAVSLNATDNETRDYVMPINKRYPLEMLLEACRKYVRETKDKVTFEYVLLKGVTDRAEDALRLKRITADIPCKINIIPFNEHPGSGFERPSEESVLRFQKKLMDLGMHVLLRKTKGRDIYAACGQLRSKFEGHPEFLQA